MAWQTESGVESKAVKLCRSEGYESTLLRSMNWLKFRQNDIESELLLLDILLLHTYGN